MNPKFLAPLALLVLFGIVLGCGGQAVDPATVPPDPRLVMPPTTGGTAGATTPDVMTYNSADGKAETTVNIYMIFDGSGSMTDRPSEVSAGGKSFTTRIEGAKWATNQFLAKVPDNVNLGLLVFDSQGTREVVPLGPNNRVAFLAAIKAVSAGGGTPLGESITLGVTTLHERRKKQLGYGEFRLVVVTDGIPSNEMAFAQGISNALGSKIPIYSIGFCAGAEHPLKKHSFSYTAADSAESLAEGLQQVLAEADSVD